MVLPESCRGVDFVVLVFVAKGLVLFAACFDNLITMFRYVVCYMRIEELRELLAWEKKKKKRRKYGNKPVVLENGQRYDSTGEYEYETAVLVPLRNAGKIKFKRQVRMPIIVNGVKICIYIADWRVQFLNEKGAVERTEFWDFKGVETEVFRIKAKLVKALYGIDIILKRSK